MDGLSYDVGFSPDGPDRRTSAVPEMIPEMMNVFLDRDGIGSPKRVGIWMMALNGGIISPRQYRPSLCGFHL